MPRLRRTVQPRHVHQRGVADMIAAAHRDQALGDESAVEPDQRRDVGHGAERDVVQHVEQVRLRPLGGPEPAMPQLAIDRDQRHQRQADRGKMAETRQIVGPVRIDQRFDLGQLVAALVMIDHHDAHPEPPRFRQRLQAGGAAVHGDQQRRAFAGEHTDRVDIRAVAFEDAIRNVDQRIEPAMAQMPGEQRRRGRAVDIVVAEDRDLLAARGGIGDPLGTGFHLGQRRRIWHQLADRRIEKVLDLIDLHAPPGQHPRQHLGQLIALHHRLRFRSGARVEPVAPRLAGGRAGHAEKRRHGFGRQNGDGRRHGPRR